MKLADIKEHIAKRFPRYFAAFFGLAMLFLFMVDVFDGVEKRWQDYLFNVAWTHDRLRYGDDRILIAAIDEATLEKGWPLPRAEYAKLVRKLKAYGAKAIVFDVMFFEPDARGANNDLELMRATKEVGNVVHLAVFEVANVEVGAGMGDATKRVLKLPLPKLKGFERSAKLLGFPNIDQVLDDDGHIRSAALWDSGSDYGGVPFPSMDISGYSVYTGTPLKELYERFPDPSFHPLVNSRPPKDWVVRPGVLRKGDNPEHKQHAYRWISMRDILDGTMAPAERKALKGSVVLVGSTALGLFDHYPNPFMPRALGVEHHANDIDNLLNGDHIRRFNEFAVALIILLFAWLPVGLMRLSPASGALCTLGILGGWTAIDYYSFVRLVHVDYVAPAASLAMSFTVLTVHRIMEEQRQKKFIKGTFGQYLSPKVIDILIKDPTKLRLGGEKRDMSVLFLDIAGFTTISEIMTPEGLTEFLNQYLTGLSDVIMKYDGTIDKYIGDCIMAFWNAPLDLKDHRGHAAKAAVECIQTLETLNATKLPADFPKNKRPEIRVGLNAGSVVVGNMGSAQRLSYTVIGDEVNLSSRLEGANKFFHSRIMASESVMEGARDFVVGRELGRVRVVGKQIPIKVFELMAKKGEVEPALERFLKIYEEGVGAYNAKKFEQGEKAFEECLKLRPNDGPSSLYLKTCKDFAVIPPQDGWDGVWNLTAK